MDEILFVYGTLLQAAVQEAVIGRRLDGIPDTLPGFKLTSIFVPGGGLYPLIRPAPGETVSGQRLTLSTADLQAVDAYETSLYARARVQLASGCWAWVYCQPGDVDGAVQL
jgi:gamma-glutamylcyclotransferase (GGCT)/AIG2-like uncharacterized protein YtfP